MYSRTVKITETYETDGITSISRKSKAKNVYMYITSRYIACIEDIIVSECDRFTIAEQQIDCDLEFDPVDECLGHDADLWVGISH